MKKLKKRPRRSYIPLVLTWEEGWKSELEPIFLRSANVLDKFDFKSKQELIDAILSRKFHYSSKRKDGKNKNMGRKTYLDICNAVGIDMVDIPKPHRKKRIFPHHPNISTVKKLYKEFKRLGSYRAVAKEYGKHHQSIYNRLKTAEIRGIIPIISKRTCVIKRRKHAQEIHKQIKQRRNKGETHHAKTEIKIRPSSRIKT